jgi:Protein of unknown function (DUF2637)
VLHARDNPISQTIAGWPPIALLITIELISKVPIHRRSLAVCRLLATALIAGIAAWVSYWHMAGVASRYGETGASPYLLPLSVDGFIVVASICLVELAGRIRVAEADALVAGPAAAVKPRTASTPADVAARARRRRVRHHRLVRGVRLTHPRPRVITVQEPFSDPRLTHEVEQVVRAIRLADGKVSQRRIAQLAATSEANVRRILRRVQAAEETQPEQINGRVPELEDAPV